MYDSRFFYVFSLPHFIVFLFLFKFFKHLWLYSFVEPFNTCILLFLLLSFRASD